MVAAVTATRRALQWALVAVAALLAVWAAVPAAVPIYDGPGFPDEPYRYVQAPAGAKKTPPPTVAKATLRVNANGLNAAGYSNSAERGPQVVLYVPSGAFKAPPGVTTITVTETPQAPAPPLPADGTIVTNVYRLSATTSKGAVQVVGRGENQLPTLQMRSPSSQQPGPVFERRTSTGWERQSTLRVGQDIYQASAPVFGDWALVQLSGSGSKSGGGVNIALLVAGIAVLVLVGIIVVIRRVRGGRAGGGPGGTVRDVQRGQQRGARAGPGASGTRR
jgi:hypothetical protein